MGVPLTAWYVQTYHAMIGTFSKKFENKFMMTSSSITFWYDGLLATRHVPDSLKKIPKSPTLLNLGNKS